MRLLMIALTLLMCGAGAYLMYRDYVRGRREQPPAYGPGCRKAMLIYGLAMTAATVGIAVLMCTVYRDNPFLFSMKRLCLLSVVWPVALIDLKTYRIPNAFIGAGLAARAALLPAELAVTGSQAWRQLFGDAVAGAALLSAALLCNLMIKNAIGCGDIKLFVLMGLMLGLQGIWSAIFMSLIAAFCIAAFALLTGRKTRKDVIPFGPALVTGIYLSVFLTGM